MNVPPQAIRGVESEIRRLEQENERLRHLLTEALAAEKPFTETDSPYCLYCDVVAVYRHDTWQLTHLPTCWEVRARAALAAVDESEKTSEKE